MDWLVGLVNSGNFIFVAAFVSLVLLALAVFAKKGVFSIQMGGINVGQTESLVRATLMKEFQFAKQYNKHAKQELISREKQKGIEMNYMNTSLVFEKVFDDVAEWLLVNSISTKSLYIEEKTTQLKMTVASEIGKLNPKLRADTLFMQDMMDYCEEYTKKIIEGLVTMKTNAINSS